MIKGLGTDIVEIRRIERNITLYGEKFLRRIYTPAEQAYCETHHNKARPYAARFAAKEAIVKAFGTGFREGIGWQDIEILNDHLGKPQVILSEQLALKFDHPFILVTMSHCQEYATATAIWHE